MDRVKTAVQYGAGRTFRGNLSLQAYRRYKTASLKCKGFSLKVKWSHTVSTRSRPICPHEEVRKVDPVFQIEPHDPRVV